MTATIAPITTTRIAQPRTDAGSILRPDRAGDAPSFAELLADQSEPEAAAQSEATEERPETDADASPGSEEAESGLARDPTQTAPHQRAGSEMADVAIVPGTSAQLARETGASIRGVHRELTHAATVDLAQLARDELVAEPIKAPVKNPDKFPDGSGAPLSAAPPHPNLSASGGGVVPPNPGAHPDPMGADSPRPNPRANLGNEASRVVVPDSAVAASSEPAKAEAARVQANTKPESAVNPVATGRAELLTRLTGSAEAARGAVVGVDRAGGQAVERDARSGRTVPTPHDQSSRATREQVLASVQRGLASVLSQGGGRMTVVLRPEQLGEVRVRMEARDGVIRARLSANTEAARQTLESGLDSLRASLESRGVRVDSLEIDSPDPKGDGQARTDADARDGRKHPDSQHRQHAPDHGRGEMSTTVNDSPATRGIWTDIGIDAVA